VHTWNRLRHTDERDQRRTDEENDAQAEEEHTEGRHAAWTADPLKPFPPGPRCAWGAYRVVISSVVPSRCDKGDASALVPSPPLPSLSASTRDHAAPDSIGGPDSG
jgi:hypothetical protein